MDGGKHSEDDHILGSLDNSYMAEINGSYQQVVKQISIIPVDRNHFISIIVVLINPFSPLIFIIYSFEDLMENLLQVIGG